MDPFLGEVRIFPWIWAPNGWALCNGAQMSIQQNAALNALLGSTFGGDNRTVFNLPDLRGRTPVHTGMGADGVVYPMGAAGGTETVTLSISNLPAHTHSVNALGGTKGNFGSPKSALPATVGLATGSTTTANIYGVPPTSGPLIPLNSGSLSPDGGSAPHNNMQPFLVLNFCIAIQGLFPPRQ